MGMTYGIGNAFIVTKDLDKNTAVGAIGENVMAPISIFNFAFNEDATEIAAKKQVKGRLVTAETALGETTSTLTLSAQQINWSSLGIFLNQFPSTETSATIPILKTGKVPSTAPYTVEDPGIVAGVVSGIYVYVSDDDNSSFRKKITTGTVAAGQVEVDATANELTFHSSDAGKDFYYVLPASVSNQQMYGGKGGEKWGPIEFWGTIYNTEETIHFPNLTYKKTASFEFTGDVATLEIELSANVVDGDEYPYRRYKKQ